ncbi:unnamed protein product [Tilletia laevis]|uniref:Uncharacterized protein n=1 Tax=Tilletia laevis TaxID=157183 RepID=A0A9N8LLU4_9BASI|nr:unnamed protein product [Tilletia caries]CAD6923943.1 unnamed protein product [Tilletia laevis]CAD6971755.1 unnamed protein product [Tilletia controversa]
MLSQPELSQRKPGSAAVNKETNGVTTPFHAKGHEFGSTAEADADALLAALKGRGDRCSNITLLGLLANIPLSTSEGLAGVYCNLTATVTAPDGDGGDGVDKTPTSETGSCSFMCPNSERWQRAMDDGRRM